MKLVKAWVAFRLVRGDSMAEIMTAYRKRWPKLTLDPLYEAEAEAEEQAARAKRYRELKASGKPFTMRDVLQGE